MRHIGLFGTTAAHALGVGGTTSLTVLVTPPSFADTSASNMPGTLG